LIEFLNCKEKDYPVIAKKIIDFCGETKVWLFIGNLGAGKTTLIQHLTKAIGVKDLVQSPTFSLVNLYGNLIYHFDCYRLKSFEEALDFGIEEYIDSGKYCWIEWPSVITNILPKEIIEIKIEDTGNNSRNIIINKINGY
jgi:tRNA threonylcarbamoyladenosine biosynthesis protein TsaE